MLMMTLPGMEISAPQLDRNVGAVAHSWRMSFCSSLRRAALVLIFALATNPLQLHAICLNAGATVAADADTCCDGTHPGAACPMKNRTSHSSHPADDHGPRMESCDCCHPGPTEASLPDGSPLGMVRLAPPGVVGTGPVVLSSPLVEGPPYRILLPPRS